MSSEPAQASALPFTYPVDPGRRCDVVMKGGVTSGVVYPLTLCRLAEKFWLQNIGGTSAGAIAAAAAAACEYGRRRGTGRGYRKLEELPAWLGNHDEGVDDSHLFNLFRPAKETRGLFALLVAAISNPKQTVAFELLLSAAANWKTRVALASLPGLGLFALLFLALAQHGGASVLAALLTGLLGSLAIALIAMIGMIGYTLYRQAPAVLGANFFGICSGMRPAAAGEPEQLPLTEWLHDFIQDASGADSVLTFGDLWGGTKGPREIDLQMVTTCLTLGRPYKLPELADDFYFEPAELRKLFPDEVVAKLEEGAAAKRVGDYLPLPEPAGLPVVFAARLSLSFPVLLSTVPLYRKTVNADGTPTFLRCHFSDGGICSNFPVNFFDSALPRWPSFGINLAGPIVDDVDVWMPKTNTDPEPGPAGPIENVNGFVSGIVRSAQNWHDNSFVEMPGFRDRIAQIRFAAGEGGLNLNMPRQLIDDMSKRGELAGTKLCSRFIDGTDVPGGPPIELTWNNHRRIRQRVAYAAIEEFAMELLVGYTGNEQLVGKPRRFPANTPMANEQTYAQLRDGATSEYASFDPQQRSLAATIALIAEVCGGLWAHVRGRDLEPCKTPAMSVDAPKPAMKAGIGPPL